MEADSSCLFAMEGIERVTVGDEVIWGPGNFYFILKVLGMILKKKSNNKEPGL